MQNKPDIKDLEAFSQLKLNDTKEYFYKTLPNTGNALSKDKLLEYLSGIKEYGKVDPEIIIEKYNTNGIITEENLKIISNELRLNLFNIRDIYAKFYNDQLGLDINSKDKAFTHATTSLTLKNSPTKRDSARNEENNLYTSPIDYGKMDSVNQLLLNRINDLEEKLKEKQNTESENKKRIQELTLKNTNLQKKLEEISGENNLYKTRYIIDGTFKRMVENYENQISKIEISDNIYQKSLELIANGQYINEGLESLKTVEDLLNTIFCPVLIDSKTTAQLNEKLTLADIEKEIANTNKVVECYNGKIKLMFTHINQNLKLLVEANQKRIKQIESNRSNSKNQEFPSNNSHILDELNHQLFEKNNEIESLKISLAEAEEKLHHQLNELSANAEKISEFERFFEEMKSGSDNEQKLNNIIKELEGHIAALIDEKTELKNQNESLDHDLKQFLSKSVQEAHEKDLKIEALNTEKDTLNNMLEALKVELQAVKENESKLNLDNMTLENKIGMLTEMLTETEQKLSTAEADFENTLNNERNQNKSLEETNKGLEQTISELSLSHNFLQVELAQLEAKLSELIQDKQANETAITELKTKLESNNQEIEKLASERDGSNLRIEDLERMLNETTSDLQNKLAEINTLTEENASQKVRMDELMDGINKLLAENEQFKSFLASVQEESEKLHLVIQRSEKQIEENQQAIDELKYQVNDLTNSETLFKENLESLKLEINNKSAEIQNLHEENSAKQAKIDDLMIGINALLAENEGLKSSLAQSQEEADKLHVVIQRSEREIEEHQQNIDKLQYELDDMKNYSASLKNQVEELNLHSENKSREVYDLTAEIEAKHSKINELSSHHNKLFEDHENLKQRLRHEIFELKSSYISTKSELEEFLTLKNSFGPIEQEINDLVSNLETKSNELNIITEENSILQGKIDGLMEGINKLLAENETLKTDLASAQDQAEKLQIVIERNENELGVCHETIGKLEYENGDLKHEIQSNNSTIKELTGKIDEKIKVIDYLAAHAQKTEAELQNKISENNQLASNLHSLTEEDNRKQLQIDELMIGINKLLSENETLNSSLSEKKEEAEKLHVVIQRSEKQIEEQQQEIDKLQYEINDMKNYENNLKDQIENIALDYEAKVKELNELIAEYEIQQTKMDDLMNGINKLLEENEVLKSSLAASQEEAEKLHSVIQRSEKENENHQEIIVQLQYENTDLKNEIQSLQNESLQLNSQVALSQKTEEVVLGLLSKLESNLQKVDNLSGDLEKKNEEFNKLICINNNLNSTLQDKENQIMKLQEASLQAKHNLDKEIEVLKGALVGIKNHVQDIKALNQEIASIKNKSEMNNLLILANLVMSNDEFKSLVNQLAHGSNQTEETKISRGSEDQTGSFEKIMSEIAISNYIREDIQNLVSQLKQQLILSNSLNDDHEKHIQNLQSHINSLEHIHSEHQHLRQELEELRSQKLVEVEAETVEESNETTVKKAVKRPNIGNIAEIEDDNDREYINELLVIKDEEIDFLKNENEKLRGQSHSNNAINLMEKFEASPQDEIEQRLLLVEKYIRSFQDVITKFREDKNKENENMMLIEEVLKAFIVEKEEIEKLIEAHNQDALGYTNEDLPTEEDVPPESRGNYHGELQEFHSRLDSKGREINEESRKFKKNMAKKDLDIEESQEEIKKLQKKLKEKREEIKELKDKNKELKLRIIELTEEI